MLLEKIGEGGMGTVYMARQLSLDRVVALKILSPVYARDKNKRERFLKEAKASAKLHHPNIISIHSAGFDGGQCYYAMEYIEGGSVKDIINKNGKIEEVRALEIVYDIAQALQHAFQKHLIHRDVKPENFMVTKDGIVKLCDLGLAKILDGDDASQTQVGTFMGTPYYTSPEQAKGHSNIDIRSDLYSLGASLFHMVTGRHPFEGTSPISVITMHINDQPPLVSNINPAISKGTVALINKLLEKNPDDRYQTPLELMEAIGEILKKNHKRHKSFRATQQLPAVEMEAEGTPLNFIKPIAIALGVLFVALIFLTVIKKLNTKPPVDNNTKPLAVKSGLLESFNNDKQKFLPLLTKTELTTAAKREKFKEISDIYSNALPTEVKNLAIEMNEILEANGIKLTKLFLEKATEESKKFFNERKFGKAFRVILTISDPKLNIYINDLIKDSRNIFFEDAMNSRKAFLNKLIQEEIPIKSNEDFLQIKEVRDLLAVLKEFEDKLIVLNKEIFAYNQKSKVASNKSISEDENQKKAVETKTPTQSKLSPELLSLAKSLNQNIADKKLVETYRLYLKNKDSLQLKENEDLMKVEFPDTVCAIESIENVYRSFSRNIRRLMEGESIEIASVRYTLVKVAPDSLNLMNDKKELKIVEFDKLSFQMLQSFSSSLRQYDQELKFSSGIYAILAGEKAKGEDILKSVDDGIKEKYKIGIEKLK